MALAAELSALKVNWKESDPRKCSTVPLNRRKLRSSSVSSTRWRGRKLGGKNRSTSTADTINGGFSRLSVEKFTDRSEAT
jgi:hypothetical protein